MKRLTHGVVGLALVLGFGREASATVARALPVRAHVEKSQLIVEGTVGSSTTLVDEHSGRPVTDTVVEVERVWRGPRADRVSVRRIGGEIDGRVTAVVGDGELRTGERVVLFLQRGPGHVWFLTALAQSVYHVTGSGEESRVERRLHGLVLLGPGADGSWVAVPPERAPRLAELRAAIRSAVRELEP